MKAAIKIRAVDGLDPKIQAMLIWLQLVTLPADPVVESTDGYWWIGYYCNLPVAYVGMLTVESWPKAGYIARVGVMSDYRGQGLQKRLLAICERKARAIGWKHLISTTYCNPASANSFVARQYRIYEPQIRWGAEETIYWIKKIQ